MDKVTKLPQFKLKQMWPDQTVGHSSLLHLHHVTLGCAVLQPNIWMQQNKSLHTAHEAAESKSDWTITKLVKTVKTTYLNHIVWFRKQTKKKTGAWSDAPWQPWLSASIQIHNLAFPFQLSTVQAAKTMFVMMNIMLSWKCVFELVCDPPLGRGYETRLVLFD